VILTGTKIQIEVNRIENGWVVSDSYYATEKAYRLQDRRAVIAQVQRILEQWLEFRKKAEPTAYGPAAMADEIRLAKKYSKESKKK